MATTPKYFNKPFAENGNLATIPDVSGGSGDVSYNIGWGPNYEDDQTGGPPALDIERDKMNELGFQETNFAKAVFEEGILVYDAVVNYEAGALTQGSDDVIYQAVIANGPILTNAQDPVTDATRTAWAPQATDMSGYSATFNYFVGDYAKGSDDNLYRTLIANGPLSSVVDPVGDGTGTWDEIAGSSPVGSMIVLTGSGNYNPTAGTKSFKVYATGGGGAGGGCGNTTSTGAAGGGGGTAIQWVPAPLDASYSITIGAGGTGVSNGTGNTGGTTTFDGTGVNLDALGGAGGVETQNASSGQDGAVGGTATGGDINLDGGASGAVFIADNYMSSNGAGGSSYWGGGPKGVDESAGIDAINPGSGGGGASSDPGSFFAGGDGADGLVVIEEYH